MAKLLEKAHIANRYAKAFLEKALEENQLDAVNKSVEDFTATTHDAPDLLGFLAHPKLPQAEKLQFAKERLEQAVHPLLYRLIALLIENDRAALLDLTLQRFQEAYRQHQKMVTAVVTTPKPLSDGLIEKLSQQLAHTFNYNTVTIQNNIDPDLLGGLTVRLGDQLVDASFAGSLKRLVNAR